MSKKSHELKSWPEYFNAMVDGKKTFDVRHDDRGYAQGDQITYREWLPDREEYTGKSFRAKVTYMMKGEPFLPADICVMAIVKI